MDTITGRHNGSVIVVAGTSPYNPGFMPEDIPGSIVIGVNNAPKIVKCNYMLTCDTHRLHERMENVLSYLPSDGETFFNRDVASGQFIPKPTHWFRRLPGSVDNDNFPRPNYPLSTVWTGHLQFVATSATAAVHLAVIMGASKIILYKVDLIGNTISAHDTVPWAYFSDMVNAHLKKVKIPIFKTNPDSPLEVPILEF